MNRPLKLGIAGLGTVGTGLLQLLAEHGGRLARNAGRSIEVVGVSARSRTKKRAVALKGIAWFDEPARLAADPSIDVFIELIGGEDGAAKSAVEAALAAGKDKAVVPVLEGLNPGGKYKKEDLDSYVVHDLVLIGPAALPPLQGELESKNAVARQVAKAAVAQLQKR